MFRFCPRCGHPLEPRSIHGVTRGVCTDSTCGYVHWDNPTPVVAAIVEHEEHIVLARAPGWPDKVFGLITGFLEREERPEDAVLREVGEELSLDGELVSFVGHYPFPQRNEIILAWHVRGHGTIRLNEELEEVRRVHPDRLRPWPFGTGLAVRDWLARRG
mgnify:FL=1